MPDIPLFNPGSLVSARGREWVVLPTPKEFSGRSKFLYVKPLDGSEIEATGIMTDLEDVEPAKFALPDPKEVGNDRSCRYLRDALRFAVRSGAGPFRSFARYEFEPRPYQFAPLMLALKQSTVRLLVADDVGVGKTIETGMIIRELLDRGEASRFCVICPPHLAEQWRRELYDKFQLDATLVLAGTIKRLERELAQGESVFRVHPYTIASLDFLKSDVRREDFLRSAPDLIVVDEAHAVSCEPGVNHQRYQLARKLAEDANRHIVLVTATPHSGKADAFRSLLGLLDKKFLDEAEFPTDLRGDANKKRRQELARYFIQRRRVDVEQFLDASTPFPECAAKDQEWTLSPAYKALFNRALAFAREMVEDKSGGRREQRVRWWSALSLMRSLASSPAAAQFTLSQRSGLAPGEGEEGQDIPIDRIDEQGRAQTLDSDTTDPETVVDTTLGADTTNAKDKSGDSTRRKLNAMAKEAMNLRGTEHDYKLVALIKEVKNLLKDGFNPIVFCRFIPTVDYLLAALREESLGKEVAIEGVTGILPPEERERRVEQLADAKKRVLICTDCLSEGINLQNLFNAVVHYDLSWNPTRHEQREGRVDRFGQSSAKVRSTTFYGKDNGIDGLVLNILLRKHQNIKNSLGVSVPLPSNSQQLMEAIFNGFLISGARASHGVDASQPLLPGMAEYYESLQDEKLRAAARAFHAELDEKARELAGALENEEELQEESKGSDYKVKRQSRSQTYFAHVATQKNVADIKRELTETRRLIGSSADARLFVKNALRDVGASVVERQDGALELDLTSAPQELRDYLPNYDQWRLAFDQPVPSDAEFASRAHPAVTGLADYVINEALDPTAERALASRCGAIRTTDVERVSTLLLLRMRFRMVVKSRNGGATETIAESVELFGFTGRVDRFDVLDEEAVEKLLDARPTGNMTREAKTREVAKVLVEYERNLEPFLNVLLSKRARELHDAHLRVANAMDQARKVEVHPDAFDVVGIYRYLPDLDNTRS